MRRVRTLLRIDRLGWGFAGLVSIGLVMLVMYALSSQQATIDDLRARNSAIAAQGADAQSQYQSLVKEYAQLYTQAESAGATPTTVDPSDVPTSVPVPSAGATGARGAAGDDGRGIAFALCTATGWAVTYTDGDTENAGDCIGKTGPAGKTGADGSSGTAGQNGVDGVSITGPAGPAGPAGATGATGPAGADGHDGVSVSSVSCVATATGAAFRFTLTDGTTQDVPGDCTPPAPDPTTTPAP